MKELEEFFKQDIFNPKYLFHGTSHELEKIELRQSKDSENKNNEDNAIFLTSWIISAAAYAFSRKLKELNEYYSFTMNNKGELPAMVFEVDNVPEELYSYIYVFEKTEDMIKDNDEFTTQYRCFHELIPQKAIKVYYKDFAQYFERQNPQFIKNK